MVARDKHKEEETMPHHSHFFAADLQHLPSVETCGDCPQAFLSLDFHCGMDVSTSERACYNREELSAICVKSLRFKSEAHNEPQEGHADEQMCLP